MYKTLTAGLTALALTLVPAAPVQAQSNNDELNRAIVSLLAIGAIGLAIKNGKDQRAADRETRRAQEQRHRNVQNVHDNRRFHDDDDDDDDDDGWRRQTRRVDLLPGRCFRRVETGRGNYQSVFSGRCLERRYRDAHTLPRQCAVRMGGADGRRVGYDARCLRDFGYRTDRRWN